MKLELLSDPSRYPNLILLWPSQEKMLQTNTKDVVVEWYVKGILESSWTRDSVLKAINIGQFRTYKLGKKSWIGIDKAILKPFVQVTATKFLLKDVAAQLQQSVPALANVHLPTLRSNLSFLGKLGIKFNNPQDVTHFIKGGFKTYITPDMLK